MVSNCIKILATASTIAFKTWVRPVFETRLFDLETTPIKKKKIL